MTSEGGWEDDVPFPQVRYDMYGLVPCLGARYHYHHLVFFKRKKPTLQVLPLPDNEIMYSALSAALEKGQQWERVSTLKEHVSESSGGSPRSLVVGEGSIQGSLQNGRKPMFFSEGRFAMGEILLDFLMSSKWFSR